MAESQPSSMWRIAVGALAHGLLRSEQNCRRHQHRRLRHMRIHVGGGADGVRESAVAPARDPAPRTDRKQFRCPHTAPRRSCDGRLCPALNRYETPPVSENRAVGEAVVRPRAPKPTRARGGAPSHRNSPLQASSCTIAICVDRLSRHLSQSGWCVVPSTEAVPAGHIFVVEHISGCVVVRENDKADRLVA
jgi:hypothetical protein